MSNKTTYRDMAAARFAREKQTQPARHLDRLTRDTIAAANAGQSYGQYKATNPHTEAPEDIVLDADPAERQCPSCGARFAPKHRNVKYCSATCRTRVDTARRAEKARKLKEGKQID